MSKRRLEIDIIVDERGSTRGFSRMGREVDTLESRMRRMGATGARVLGGAVVAAAAAAGYEIKRSVDEAREANKVGAQTAAVITSTGGSAQVTEKQVAGLAGALSLKAGIDDEAIQSGANLLLTFKDIRNEAGKGNDIFNQSTQTIVDMSVALDQDLKSSAIQVGKALNDPIKGLTALQRVGVTFSEQKAEQIKQWVEEGNILRAQKAILRELNSEFGGSAAAQADSFDKLKVGIENAEEQIGHIFIPILSDAADEITREFLPRIERAAGALHRIFGREDLDVGEKLTRSTRVFKREFGDIPPVIAGVLEESVPIVASRAGVIGVAAAKGTLKGFVEADVWGKLAIGAFLISKFGGVGAFRSIGTKAGGKWGAGFIAALLGIELGKQIKQIIEGHKLDSTVREEFATELSEWFEGTDAQLAGFIGDSNIKVATKLGDLIFSAETERVVRARGRRLQQFVGKIPAQILTDFGRLERLESVADRGFKPLPGLARQAATGMNRNLVPRLDTLVTQAGKKGDALERRLGGSFTGLDATSAKALDNLGRNVSEVMQRLGATNVPEFTVKSLVNSLPELPPMKAQGGPVTVPGVGLHDSVPLAVNGKLSAVVAPGETLVAFNRHQTPLVDRALANEYGVAGLNGFFNAYDRPHYLAKGGLVEPRIAGPDPLRSLAQAGIHKAFLAGEAYVARHQPQGGGVAGYSGPPADMRQLGDAAWVDAHTLAVAAYMERRFGLGQSSGYRDAAHNAAVGGVAGSLHTHGSPANPGAIDFTPPSRAALAFSRTHIAGLEEAMIHDAGSGLHLHLGFFAKGGKIDWAGLVGSSWDNDELATLAHMVGMPNPGFMAQIAQGESSGRAAAVGDDPGGTEGLGLWQITTGYNDELIAELGGREAIFDPLINARAAKEILDDQGVGAWYAPPTGPRGEVDSELADRIRAAMDGEDAAPASKRQKHTLGSLAARAKRLLRDARQLKAEYKEQGGTKRGRRALNRTLRLAKEAARKVKAGDREGAERLIDKARSTIGSARDSLEQAGEGLFTPGLKPGTLPELGTETFDPGQAFSPANLPGFGELPPGVLKALKSPGLNWAGRYGLLEGALTSAELTDTRADDASALNAMLGMNRSKRQHLKKLLTDLNKRLAKGKLTKAQRAKLVERRDQVLQGLNEVEGNISSIQGQIGGLNEASELAEEDPALKAAEEQRQAAEELAAAVKDLKASIDQQNKIAESELAVGLIEARRVLADIFSGEIGARVDHRAQTAGAGTVGSL